MTVEDAVMQLNLLGDELLVFTDAGSGRTSRSLSAQGRQLRAHRDRGRLPPAGARAGVDSNGSAP